MKQHSLSMTGLWSAIIRAAAASLSDACTAIDSGMMSACCSWRERSSAVAWDVLRLVVSFLRSSRAIRAENLVLRRQLARYIERGIKPRRVDHATRVSLALFSRLFDWRDAVVIVQTGDHRSLASTGLADLLALEVQGGPATDSARTAPADSPDGGGESAMGRGANCQ